MRTVFALLLLAVAAHGALHIKKNSTALGPTRFDPVHGEVIIGEWIVMFNADITDETRAKHMTFHAQEDVLREYSTGILQGYAARFDDSVKDTLLALDHVKYIEPNGVVYATDCAPAIPMHEGVWGTIRTNNRERVTSGDYYEELGAGQDVHSYVIDTGIDINHPAFEGRAHHGIDYTREGNGDENGHGTHVAGTMIGSGYGIAQEGDTSAVKVLGRGGSGSYANVIAGIEWTAEDAGSDKKNKGVANLSLGGGFSQAVSDAIEAVFEKGIICVVAAGNDNRDACSYSPAAAPDSICVGSTTNTDARSSFSNWGSCLDIFAPGSNILSTTPNGGSASYSGTSMAAPHVAGIVQAFWSNHPNEPTRRIKQDILEDATPDKVTNPGTRSPNFLGYSRCVNAVAEQ